jgi:hypothetical protein
LKDVVAFFKKYWDIIGGILAGLGIAVIARFELGVVQLCYSVIILIIVCIGILRLVKETSKKDDRKHTAIDAVVDSQKPIKAICLAQSPVEEGEKIGKKFLSLWGGLKPMKEKLKNFFSKFKGYVLTVALAILSVAELCGGFINSALGGALTIRGVEVLPLVTLVSAVAVGAVSNGYTREQRDKIKALFSKSNTNELVLAEIKKQIKEKSAQLAQFNKAHTTQEHELANYESELEALNNALQAKREMFAMVPQLATNEDVQLATNAVEECKAKILAKADEIRKTEDTIDTLTTTINALRSQL